MPATVSTEGAQVFLRPVRPSKWMRATKDNIQCLISVFNGIFVLIENALFYCAAKTYKPFIWLES